jgi:hypothetical protein
VRSPAAAPDACASCPDPDRGGTIGVLEAMQDLQRLHEFFRWGGHDVPVLAYFAARLLAFYVVSILAYRVLPILAFCVDLFSFSCNPLIPQR